MTKTIKKYLLIFFLLIIIGNVMAFLIEPQAIVTPKIIFLNSVYSLLIGFSILKANEFVLRIISKKLEWKENPLKKFFISLGALVIITLLVTFLAFVIIQLFTGINILSVLMQKAVNIIIIQVLILIYFFSLFTGIEFFILWKKALIKQESMQRRAVELQLEAIKNQVNPHFLFNSLNCLSSLVHVNQDLAVEFIDKLSEIYRYVLEQKDKKTIVWKKEKQFLKNYLELMKVRFNDNLKYQIRIDESVDIQVIPLSIQMLAENAIKHNIISDEKALQIEVFIENEFIVIRNNLQVKNIVEESHNIGLENISAQYEILSGKKVLITSDGGYFTVMLPIITKSNLL